MSNELEHYGVKGMKWGVRKKRDSGGSSGGEKISRKQNRQMNRAARKEFDQKKAATLVKQSLAKGDKVMIKALMQGDTYPQVMSGKEFANQVSKGRGFDVRMTDVYATRKGSGPYELGAGSIGNYKKQNFREKR